MTGVVIAFDDAFASPHSEIKLANGEHVILTLERRGLKIAVPSQAGGPTHIVFECDAGAVADICNGVLEMSSAKSTPLRVLTSIAVRFPNSTALVEAFEKASA